MADRHDDDDSRRRGLVPTRSALPARFSDLDSFVYSKPPPALYRNWLGRPDYKRQLQEVEDREAVAQAHHRSLVGMELRSQDLGRVFERRKLMPLVYEHDRIKAEDAVTQLLEGIDDRKYERSLRRFYDSAAASRVEREGEVDAYRCDTQKAKYARDAKRADREARGTVIEQDAVAGVFNAVQARLNEIDDRIDRLSTPSAAEPDPDLTPEWAEASAFADDEARNHRMREKADAEVYRAAGDGPLSDEDQLRLLHNAQAEKDANAKARANQAMGMVIPPSRGGRKAR